MLPLGVAVAAIGLSMVAGAIDVIRLPGWAWRKAEEPKIAYLALVGLLPIVGLGMYLVRARPKVKGVAVAGRAASLPFERFGDGAPPMDEEQVAEAPEPIQLVAVKPDLASTIAAAPSPSPVGESVTKVAPAPEVEDEPSEERQAEPVLVGGDFFSPRTERAKPAAAPTPAPVAATAPEPVIAVAAADEPEPERAPEPELEPALAGAGAATGAATATATRTMRLPASLTSKQYKPRQRSNLAEGRLTAPVPAGWKADPTGRHQFRYWNGLHWTENVADAGVQNRDAVCA
jgi:hypothetical protein